MKPSLLLSLGFTASVTAFFPYIPPGHPGAQRKVHSIGESISRGFAFVEKDASLEQQSLLSKASLKKRAYKNARLAKRLNDFKVEADNTPSQKQSAAIDQDGTDFSYFAEVSIGSNTVYMLLDSGSSALWVMGQGCSSSACQTHQLSSSSNTTSDQFSLSYNSGTVSGVLASDQLQLAGMTLDVTVGLASQTSDDFNQYPMDGILGLARSANGTDFNADTFIQTVKAANLLPANVFGVWLDRAGGPKDGEINFGAPDTTRFQGELNYIDTNSDLSVWNIPAGDILVNGQSSGLSGRSAVIDTGTTYMFVPPSDADAIFKNIEGATLPSGNDMYNIPCDTTANISVVFNNVAYQISPKDYVGPSVSSGVCYTHIIGLAAVNGDDSTWLLGDTFLKNVYTVFDADQNRVGFGLPAESVTATSSGGSSPSSSSTAAATTGKASDSANGLVGGGSSTSGGSSTGNSQGGGTSSGGGSVPASVKDDGDAMGSIGAGAALNPVRAGFIAVGVAALAASLI